MESEKEVSLSQRQNAGRLATHQFAIRSHFVSLRIDSNARHGVIPFHILFADLAAAKHRLDALGQAVSPGNPLFFASFAHKGYGDGAGRDAKSSKHRPHSHRL